MMNWEQKMNVKHWSFSILVGGLMALTSAPASAATVVGEVGLVTGRSTAAAGAGDIRSLARGDSLYEGEVISTGPASYVNLKFSDGGRVLLRPNSRFQIDRFEMPAERQPATGSGGQAAAQEESSGSAFFSLLKGGFRAVTGLIGRSEREDYQVRTPVATIGIRGTDYEARICAGDCFDVDPIPNDGLYTAVNEGGIVLTNEAGEEVSLAGQFAFVGGPTSNIVGLQQRPRPLAQDPIPDPEVCD